MELRNNNKLPKFKFRAWMCVLKFEPDFQTFSSRPSAHCVILVCVWCYRICGCVFTWVACTYPGGGRNVEGASRLAHYGRQSGTLSSKKTKKRESLTQNLSAHPFASGICSRQACSCSRCKRPWGACETALEGGAAFSSGRDSNLEKDSSLYIYLVSVLHKRNLNLNTTKTRMMP